MLGHETATEPIDIDALRRADRVAALNVTRGTGVADFIHLALGPWQRTRGLIARSPLAQTEGMLLRPCRSIHTCFMTYAIDLLFLERNGTVVRTYSAIAPWRFTAVHFSSYCVLELAAGAAARSQTEEGDRVAFCHDPA